MIQSFLTFLREATRRERKPIKKKFLKGVLGFGGYADVHGEPVTKSDLHDITGGNPRVQVGGILSGDNLYVWDRDAAAHAEVKHILPQPLDPNWLPLYLYYDENKGVVQVEVSFFTMDMEKRRGYNTPEEQRRMTDRLMKSPELNSLGRIKVVGMLRPDPL